MTNPIAEIVTYRLKPGADLATFRAAASKADAYTAGCSGHRGQWMSQSRDGGFTHYALWDSTADLEAAEASFMDAPGVAEFLAFIDEASLVMLREPVLSGTA